MPKVFVMMSGGVDSSVAAAVLKEQGYDVVGVFMKCWSLESLESMGLSRDLYGCFWEDDLQDASLVATKLGIPFEVWDFQSQYKARVVDYMLREYQVGRTPNPDVMCNGLIKFGIFYEQALIKGADFVATGHYARVEGGQIYRGLDEAKDQSYFLWQIRQDQLPHILFPIGELASKQEVRQEAEKLGLLTADKPDSQGLCFIGDTPLRELLLQTLGQQEGQTLEQDSGQVLGRHPGAFLYTIGQREKLGLSGGPWFVSKIDVERNTVFVTHQRAQKELYGSTLACEGCNWQASLSVKSFACQAQVRYRQTPVTCQVTLQNDDQKAQVVFDAPVRAIASGQSVVFYDQGRLLGGGIIV